MGFLDKVKNMFIEEYEDDEPIKKEEIQVKIEAPIKDEIEEEEIEFDEELENINEEKEEKVIKENLIEIKKIEPKKPLPTFFDDNDFDDFEPVKKEVSREIPKEIPVVYGSKKEEIIIKPTISGYNGKKEEKRKQLFEPTPIISPVYGVLDKNYKKDEITSKKQTPKNIIQQEEKLVNVDDIRKKAFGSLEDELENTLESREHLMFTSPVKKEVDEIVEEDEAIDIFAELEKVDTLDQLLNSYDFDEEIKVEDTLSRNYDMYESKYDDEKELNDSDLFNLIDSMYEKRNDE